MINQKKAAIELSISTVVIIVLAMTMLILALGLIRNIFVGATDSVNTLDDKVQQELANLFPSEGDNVIIKLGSDFTAKIKPDTADFKIAIGAKTSDGSTATETRLKYKLTLDTATTNNCIKVIGRAATERLFITSLDQYLQFDKTSDDKAYSLVEVTVPKGTAVCSQKVRVTVKDFNTNQEVGTNSFIVQIIKSSFLG